MSDVDTFIRVVTWLQENPDLAAITVGLLNSWGMTQFLKFQLVEFKIDHKKWTRIVAFFIGLATVLSIWIVAVPTHWVWGLQWGMIVGSLSPMLYKMVTFILYKFFPGTEKYLAADHGVIRIKYDEDGNAGVKVDDDLTQYFKRPEDDTTRPNNRFND